MIIRVVLYHALPNKDVEAWVQGTASELREVPGIRHVEFVRSHSDPSQYGVVTHFGTKENLDAYKASAFYQRLVQSLREAWLDESKPVTEQILEVLDI